MALYIQRNTGTIFSGHASQLAKRADLEPYSGPLPGDKTEEETAKVKPAPRRAAAKAEPVAAEPVVAEPVVAEPVVAETVAKAEPVAATTETIAELNPFFSHEPAA